jgi:hypothetical protein
LKQAGIEAGIDRGRQISKIEADIEAGIDRGRQSSRLRGGHRGRHRQRQANQ